MATTLIYVIEDDPTLTRAIERNLTVRGYDTRSATTVAAANALLHANTSTRPVVLLLDIDLPDGSGWEVLRTAREIGHLYVASIVMSALRPNPRLVEELGVVGVLEKPFPMESLLRLVAQLVRATSSDWGTSPQENSNAATVS